MGYYKDGLKDKMEIIFVSSDKDEAAFKEYHGEMPWPALPYEKRKEKDLLSKHMGVQGIPTFAVINPDGTIVTTEAAGKDISEMKMRFFEAPDGNVTAQIRKLTKIEEGNKLVVLDIPSGDKFYVCDGVVSDAAAVKAFLAKIDAGDAEQKSFS